MATPAEATSVRNEIVVNAPVERAFAVFTEQMDRIKPREHNMLGVDIAETVFEQRVGGRIYDRGTDGRECEWATVLAYEPPDRVVFSWNISPHWQVETNPDKRSEVEVRFIAEDEQRTRVQLEHRHLDRHGDGWEGAPATALPPPTAGASTSAATPTSCEALRRAPRHHRPGGRPPPAAFVTRNARGAAVHTPHCRCPW